MLGRIVLGLAFVACGALLPGCGAFEEEEAVPPSGGNRSSSSRGALPSSSSGSVFLNIDDIDWQEVSEESAVHGTVEISLNPFSISRDLITQRQYKIVMGENPSKGAKDDDLPVEGVTWFKAAEFCKKLSLMLGLDENAIRMPTEAEWEFAVCSASAYPACPPEPAARRNMQYWEWTNDCFDSEFPYGGITENPSGPPNCLPAEFKVRKGLEMPFDRRFATDPYLEDIGGGYISFRIMMEVMGFE